MCGGRDRFSVNIKKQVWNCRRGCGKPGGDVIDLVQALDGVNFIDAVKILAGPVPPQTLGLGGRGGAGRTTDSAAPQKGVPDRGSLAMAIWCESGDPHGTPVETYLRSRRLELPDEPANEVIRFNADCLFGSERFPAMVCLVRNVITNEPQAIHRTALAPDGTAIKRDGKTHRMSLGPITGGAIKLDPDEDVTQGVCIGEGVETCLAGRQMGFSPVWSAVNTAGVANFPVIAGIDGLHVFRENDPNCASAKAVEACCRRWYDAGRGPIIVDPDTAKDLNDELW